MRQGRFQSNRYAIADGKEHGRKRDYGEPECYYIGNCATSDAPLSVFILQSIWHKLSSHSKLESSVIGPLESHLEVKFRKCFGILNSLTP
jgi:ATP-dependent helicase YprA (DUF1998 family)